MRTFFPCLRAGKSRSEAETNARTFGRGNESSSSSFGRRGEGVGTAKKEGV